MNRLSDLFEDQEKLVKKPDCFLIQPDVNPVVPDQRKKRVNIVAAGDVGSMLLTGLHLMGGKQITSIGIYDLNGAAAKRIEMEVNQVQDALSQREMPQVEVIQKESLFQCDILIFTASKGVPPLKERDTDVRMAQLEANKEIVKAMAAEAVKEKFAGLFAVVSDPVDPLCKAAYLQGLSRDQVQGYGLGVMNSRALYFSKQEEWFSAFEEEGRVFGPHGQDLVVADSVQNYNHPLSMELTRKTVNANTQVRDLGFKPYIGPALSSGTLSILDMMEGRWHYSSVYFGRREYGAFLGVKNKRTHHGIVVEDLPLPDALFARIQSSYKNLKDIL